MTSDEPPRPTRRERARLERLAAHLSAAFRLRAALSGDDAEVTASPDAATESVFDARGRRLHADCDARGKPERASLAEALTHLRASERAARTSPDEALRLWRALVDGRWSLVAHVDTDGKRLVLARRNEPAAPAWPTLTPCQRRAAAFGALGHPIKLIAYELGIAPSTAAAHLAAAVTKLGLASRADLIKIFGGAPPA